MNPYIEQKLDGRSFRSLRKLTPEERDQRDKEYAAAYQKKRMAEFRYKINKYKVEKGCIDCGYNLHAVALDLDHVRGTKVRPVSQMGLFSQKKIDEELAKCEVVCANCHRVRTHQRGFKGGL